MNWDLWPRTKILELWTGIEIHSEWVIRLGRVGLRQKISGTAKSQNTEFEKIFLRIPRSFRKTKFQSFKFNTFTLLGVGSDLENFEVFISNEYGVNLETSHDKNLKFRSGTKWTNQKEK